jgi:hypothetical protein
MKPHRGFTIRRANSRGAGLFSGARRLRMISLTAVIRSSLASVRRSCGAQTCAMPALSRHPPDDWLPNPSLQPADGIFTSGPSPGMPGCSNRRRDRGAAFGKLRNCLHQGAPLSWVLLELMATQCEASPFAACMVARAAARRANATAPIERGGILPKPKQKGRQLARCYESCGGLSMLATRTVVRSATWRQYA